MKRLLAIYFLTALSALAVEPSFSGMEDGDRIEMSYRSTGCFRDITSYYEVAMKGGACFFTEYAITWNSNVPDVMSTKKVIGVVQLKPEDLVGLDGLLRYYRGKKDVGSTTYDTLLVEYFEGGKRIKVEDLDDISGGFGLREKKGVASFYELAQRFKGAGS